MKTPVAWVAAIGAVAVFFAIVTNLATATDSGGVNTLAIESAIAAIIAVACGAFMVTRGKSWKFYAIALIGPGLFVLADSGMRLVFLLRHP